MGTKNLEYEEPANPIATPAVSERCAPAEARSNPLAKTKVAPADRVYLCGEPTGRDKSKHLTYQALRTAPSKEALHQFEQEDFADRQVALAELRLLEEVVSLKGLPAALALIPVAVAIIGNSLKSPSTVVPEWIMIVVGLYVAVAAVAILWGIRDHAGKEARLTAWTKAFEDSHSRATKKEDEQLKADFAAFNAPEPVSASPSDCAEVDAVAGRIAAS